ncbi:MAG: zinc ribbon domain-containing protein [Ruminiclostridium sp.]
MAMIQCPECGQEISDKTKKCIHCGKVFIEEVQPIKYCAECGKAIPFDAQECPFCGCPVEEDKPINSAVEKFTEKAKKNKTPLIFIAAIVAVVIIVGLIIIFVGSTLNEDEQLAYQNAVTMQKMMKDPDSFKLYDEMFLLRHYDENGENDYTYTIFKYGGANGYGAITTDEAIFKDGEYIMNYADEPDEDDSNYLEQLKVKINLTLWQISGDGDSWKTVEIDIEKIKNKMGLK